uniref:WD repeat-containing protein 75 second beta-propeller domain-containing protein n=1 Tax=Pygocentrus nattereri TaxID=42514 RepID=A0AAR2JID9_PYGNA
MSEYLQKTIKFIRLNIKHLVFVVFLLCASGDLVKVFSTSTEECVHVLEGHTGQVTGVILNPTNHLQVYSCSADGTIRLWDFIDGILIKTQVSKSVFVSPENFQLVALHLPKVPEQEVEAREMSAVLCNISSNPGSTAMGRGGEYVASVMGRQLTVYFFKKLKTYRFSLKATDKKGAKNAFTCVACHPKDDCIATGHEDGKIRLWRNFNQKKEYTYSTQHWHHDAVGTLCFTTEGMHLLSGGVESVLVQWHCEEVNKKDFLPRLGGAISHICVSPDGQMYSTSHLDNKINIIHCSLKLSAVIQGLVKGNIWTDLMIDPRTRALVMNGRPGHLQFYSLQQDKQLYSLDIVQQEYINQEGLDQFEVMRAAFSVGGTWLATVEERGRCTSDLESSLKLWVYNEKAQSFELNTTITAAHQDRIMHMCFSPSTETTMLVTTAWDNQFKVWLLGLDSDTQKEHASWSCDYVGSYHGLQPTNCCFSSDGSLLAVSFKEVVTIWSSDTWELLTTLCQPPGPIRELCFGRLSCSKYLLGTTAKNLFCWNLLTCSCQYPLQWFPNIYSPAFPQSLHVLLSSPLFVFRPSEPRPLFTQKAVCGGKVQRCVFSPREEPLDSCDERFQWLNRSRLYFLTELMVPLLVDDSVAVTPFYLLLGKHRQQQEEKQNSGVSQAADRVQPPQASVAIKELLHTPAHVLPAASFLCSMFVNSLLISNTGSRYGSLLVQMGRYVGWACKDLGLRAVHCRMIYSGILSPSF